MRGLFYNTQKAQCSIYESGLMAFKALARSSNYTIDYVEMPEPLPNDYTGYDFIVLNWHHYTMQQVTEAMVTAIPIRKYTVVTECAPDNPIPQTPATWFDGYLVLDPTAKDTGNIWSMPRPLEEFNPGPKRMTYPIPTFGSFGFATAGKRFDLLIQQVNAEFDRARIRINIPVATYVDLAAPYALANTLRTVTCKPGIELIITHDYLSKQELIQWCSENDLNVFLYYRDMIGLAAVTDQAVSSQQPVLVTEDSTFRHIHPYMGYYPAVSLYQAMSMDEAAKQMYQDWHPDKFSQKFEKILNG